MKAPFVPDGQPDTTVHMAVSDQDRHEYLWKIDEYLANYARFSDTKGAFIAATAISLFGWMLSQHLFSRGLQISLAAWPGALWFAAAAAILLLGSMALAIWSVYPHLRSTRARGIVFWADIATYASSADYTRAVLTMNAEELASELAKHIYDVATSICVPKFRYVSLASWSLVLGALCLGASLLLNGTNR